MAERRRESRDDYEERRQMERRRRQVDPYWEEEPGRRRKPKKKASAVGSFFSTLVLVIAIGVFVFAAYKLVGYYLDYKAGSDEYDRLNNQFANVEIQQEPQTEEDKKEILANVEELEVPEQRQAKVEAAATDTKVENGQEKTLPMLHNPINFTDLHAINEEIVGWIRIGALEISYPIAQAADNDFYLHRTFEKQDNFAGCIFMNCNNTRYMSDQNTIVYGHNMKNGSMFGTLKRFKEQETYDSNPYFWIFTPDFIYQYRIFSCAEVSAYGDPYITRFTSDEFTAFLDKLQKNSVVNTGKVDLSDADRIVTLSTCTGNSETRFVVCGKLEQIYISA